MLVGVQHGAAGMQTDTLVGVYEGSPAINQTDELAGVQDGAPAVKQIDARTRACTGRKASLWSRKIAPAGVHDHKLAVKSTDALACVLDGAPTGVRTDTPAGGRDGELVFKLLVDRRACGLAGRRLGVAAHGAERRISDSVYTRSGGGSDSLRTAPSGGSGRRARSWWRLGLAVHAKKQVKFP